MNYYEKMKEEYPEFVILSKEGMFYTARNESAFILNNVFGYHLCPEKEIYRTGCPLNLLDKVTNKLEDLHINYVVVSKGEIVHHLEFDDNEFLTYAVLSEEGKQQYMEIKKKQEERATLMETLKIQIEHMDLLVNGKNPCTGETLKQEDFKKAEVIDCIKEIQTFLNHIYQDYSKKSYSGRNRRNKRPNKTKFTEDMLSVVECSGEIKITEFVSKLNSLIQNDEVQKITAAKITSWLVKESYLEEEVKEDKKYRIPTERGNELGISAIERTGINGAYMINMYNENAQRFLIEHLPSIQES